MPERRSFIARMSAVHMVRLMAELSGLPPEAALERAHEALFYVWLGEARYRNWILTARHEQPPSWAGDCSRTQTSFS